MQILVLNVWGGRLHDRLLSFLAEHAHVDVICLQEVYKGTSLEEGRSGFDGYAGDLYGDIAAVLPQHSGFFRPSVGDFYGLATFVNRSIIVQEEGYFWLCQNPDWPKGYDHSRIAQYVVIQDDGVRRVVCNVHGIRDAQGKCDTADRIIQSERLLTFTERWNEDVILCGDFNLRPDTQSIALLSSRLSNLIAQFAITTTRTSYYPKPERYADYLFVSPGIKVVDFSVLPDEVSDHAAMLAKVL